MKRVSLIIVALLAYLSVGATTPAERFMLEYEEVKGAKNINVKGGTIVFARPTLKKYPIGPMSDLVTEITQLNMSKASDAEKERFQNEVEKMLKQYRYYGESGSPNGVVDVYVHLKTDRMVDELISYNRKLLIISSLIGDFPVDDLLKLNHKQ